MMDSFVCFGKQVPLYIHFKAKSQLREVVRALAREAANGYRNIPHFVEAEIDGFLLVIRAHITGTSGRVESIHGFGFCRKCFASFRTDEPHPDNGCPLGIVDSVMSS